MRIVPSIGFSTAWYAAADAAFSPSATLVAVRSVAPFNVADQAAQDLAEDDAAVAARAHQAPVADGVAGRVQLGIGEVELGDHGVERASHVGAGVAVGHRVDVEPVDALGVDLHRVAERDDRAAQRLGAEPFQCGHADRLGASRACRWRQPAGSISRLV